MKVAELEPQTVLYVEAQTTFRNLPATIELLMPRLTAAPAKGFAFTGPAVFRYLGATAELNKAFTLEIGFPVARGTRPVGPYQVRQDAAPFRAATVTFTAQMSRSLRPVRAVMSVRRNESRTANRMSGVASAFSIRMTSSPTGPRSSFP